jgi:hypothetical protein
VAFQVPRAIFTLTIRLIDRLAVDVGTRRTRALVVRVDVIDVDDEAGICHIYGERRIEIVLSGDAMQPDGSIPGANLAMDRPALGGSMHSSRSEPKCLNQEVVCGCDVPIGEHRDDSLEGWHELLRILISIRPARGVASCG